MLTKTPYLKGFSALLFGSAKRKMQAVMQAERNEMRSRGCGALSGQLAEEIPGEMVSRHASTVRSRVYSQEVTFWAFLAQVISEDGSCAYAVAQVQQWLRARGLPIPSSDTSSYVAARQAMPVKMLEGIQAEIYDKLDRNLLSEGLWRGRRVMAIDATSVQLPDTVENQAAFPQPSSQSPGCGFPTAQLIGLVNLCHGGLGDFAVTPLTASELRGYDMLEGHLVEGDVMVGDRLYSSYEVVARLQAKGVDFIGRNHQARKLDFRRGRKIGPNERIQVWKKPPRSARCKLTQKQWDELAEETAIRIIRTKGPDRHGKMRTRYVVTTLLDSDKYPADEVASMYVHRWEIELRFRDIKTTMGMELLRTKSPEMALKEIMMHAIAYNVVRLLMLKAAALHHCSHRRIGFKAVLQVLDASRGDFDNVIGKPRLLTKAKKALLARIAERVEPERPGRNEPRKKKRRPKSYGWLQQPRHSYPEHFTSDEPPRKILDEAA
jgi:hypothetical protein